MIYHPPHLFLKNGCNIRIFFYTFTLQTNELLLNEDMENRSLVSIAGLSKEKILYLLEMAREFEKNPNRKIMDGRVVATWFFVYRLVPYRHLLLPYDRLQKLLSVFQKFLHSVRNESLRLNLFLYRLLLPPHL